MGRSVAQTDPASQLPAVGEGGPGRLRRGGGLEVDPVASSTRLSALGAVFLACLALASPARAEAPKPLGTAQTSAAGWSSRAAEDVRAGKPLVIEVFVPLCSWIISIRVIPLKTVWH